MKNGNEYVSTVETKKGASFAFHIEKGEIVIDECEGMTASAGLSMFDTWMIDCMIENSKTEKGG